MDQNPRANGGDLVEYACHAVPGERHLHGHVVANVVDEGACSIEARPSASDFKSNQLA